ncbi:DNA primase [Chloroflexus sp. Y-396-1]|uniref:DNA primase n=1 Tax=Chloroflexus sp. Y-396-1 TaxID=867845 RepID=UPI00048A4621|nr:DNA primase [Chloroflexus sp. Y-396-1]
MSVIDDIKANVDIVDLINSMGVGLRRSGRSFVGFCPFHPNTRTPAFHVYPDTQSFYCFGCHASGTVFDFVMRKQGLDFKGALELLAERAGIRLEPKNDAQRQEDARRARLLEINGVATRYFNYVLLNLGRGEPGREYIAKRGINRDAIDAFQIGYSLDDWHHLFTYLHEKKGYSVEDIIAAGLAIPSERGPYDRFRNRIIFPIRNIRGEVIGFGGRALGDAQPKYLNTPETPLFRKSEVLYGLDLARDAIRSANRVIIVEGYVDVITAHQYGFRNVVAPLGTALSKAHINQLKRLTDQVYLALDADAAGQKATLRGLETIRTTTEEEGEGRLVTTAQGIVRLENDVTIRIIRLPAGRDPDEVIAADPQLWQTLVDNATPVMDFYLEAYTANLNMHDPVEQRLALERILPLLSELDGAAQRVYVTRVEQLTGVRSELLVDLLRARIQPPRRNERHRSIRSSSPPPAPPPTTPPPIDEHRRDTEAYFLALALRYPSVDMAIERLLESYAERCPAIGDIFGAGIEDLLEEPLHQAIWQAYLATPLELRPTDTESLQAWIATLGEPLSSEAGKLLTILARRPDDVRYRHEAEQCARILRKAQVMARIHRYKERLNELTDEEELQRVLQHISDLSTYVEQITRPRQSSTFPDLRDLLGQ